MININDILEHHTSKPVSVEKEPIDYLTILKNFTKEFLTIKDNSPLKPGYGTNFINKLGNIVNIYKIRFYLIEELELIKGKYNIEEIEVLKAYQEKDMLIIELNVIFNDGHLHNVYLKTNWKSKQFTTKEIVEEAD